MKRVAYIPQMEAAECGAAALAMVLDYYGHQAPLAEVREACGSARDGVSAAQILDAAESYGLEVKAYRLEPEELAAHKRPLIAHWQMNHFVVVERWSRKAVKIVDPAVGRRTVSHEEFDRSFTGVVLEAVPGRSFTRRRRRRPWLGPYVGLLARAPGALAMILLASLMINLLGLALPLLVRVIIDEVLPQARLLWLEVIGWSLIGMAVARALFEHVRGRVISSLNLRLDAQMSERLVRKLLRLPLSFFDQRSSADLVNRLQATSTVRELLAGGTVSVLVDGLLLVSYLALMLVYDLPLGLVVASAGALYVGIYLLAHGALASRAREAQVEEVRELAEQVQIISGLQTLKASGAEAIRRNRWHNLMVNALNAEIREERLRTGVNTALFLLRSAVPVVVISWGAVRVIDGDITLGVLIGFQLLQIGFLLPLSLVVEALLRSESVPEKLERMADILDAEPEPGGTEPCPPLEGRVAFEQVAFRYSRQGDEVLRGVSFEVPRGAKVAIVGPSGSGKSTLVRLLLGLYEPTAGRILFDDRPLAELDRPSVRRQLGAVLQSTTIFAGTVRENISLYAPEAPLDDVVRAARTARIHEHIEALPLGYDTRIAAGSGALSGGERQRLALARALLHDPAVIVLDEATSALDPETERAIDDFLRRRSCTRVVVAHRLATVRDADLILVLKDGAIVERGSHEQLLAAGGLYAELATHEAAPPPREHPARWARGGAMDRGGDAPADAGASSSAAACLAAVLRYHGRSVPLQRIIEAYGNGARSELTKLADAARAFGLRSRRMLLDPEDLRYLSAPLILELEDGRYVVAERYKRRKLHLIDPVDGKQRWSRSEMRRHFNGHCLELVPEPGERPAFSTDESLPGFLRERRAALFKLGLGSVMIQVTGLVLPLLSAVIIDRVIPSEDLSLLWLMVAALAALVLIRTVQTATRAAVVRFVRAHFDRDLTDRLMGHLLRLPVRFFGAHRPGELMQRFQSHRLLRMLLANDAVTALLEAATVFVSAIALLLLSPAMAGVVIAVALAYPLLAALGFGPLRRAAAIELEADARQQDRLLELIRGITTLRVTAAPDGGLHRWLPELTAKLRARLRQTRRAQASRTLLRLAHDVVLAVVIWWSAQAVLAGTLTVGAFFAFFAIGFGLLASMHALADKLVPAAHAAVHLARSRAILDERTEQHGIEVRPPGELRGAISLENVSFRYGDRQPLVLDNVTLEVEPGTVVALVGASGAGKSTLARLLVGFYRPTYGRVLYDGKDLASLELTAVRRQLGIVLQDDILFSGSIRENIALGRPDAHLDDVFRAARMAGLEDDLAALPMGVDTLVAEGGTTLSGGQRQKIAIARALLAEPRIVLLDEATSALDNIAQETVRERLAAIGATQIVIAHRVSTIAGADRIIVLEGGHIVEDGVHDELIASRGHYARLMVPQLGGEQRPEGEQA